MNSTAALSVILALFLVASAGAQPSSDLVGHWWVSHGDGAPLQVRLYADGTAWSDYPSNNPGQWSVEEDRAVCIWADDWKEVFVKEGEGWVKLGFAPGVEVTSAPSNRSRAYRVSEAPDGWFGVRPSNNAKQSY